VIKQANALLVILVSFFVAYLFRFGYIALSQDYLIALLLTLVLSSIILPATGAFRHEFRWSILRKTRRLLAGWALVVTTLITMSALFKVTADYSRV